jgi:hypothetical protein
MISAPVFFVKSPELFVEFLQTVGSGQVKRAEFLASAWTAANDKARELGWIV